MDDQIMGLLKTVPEKHRAILKADIDRKIKDPVVAFCLNLFLGFWGIHHFYLGKIGHGIIYLLTFGFFGLFWFIDLFAVWGYTREVNKTIALKAIQDHSMMFSSDQKAA